MNVSKVLERIENEDSVTLNVDDDITKLLMDYIDEIAEDGLYYYVDGDVVEFVNE